MKKGFWLVLLTYIPLISCGGGDESLHTCSDTELAQLEQSMTDTLATAWTDPDSSHVPFTLLLEAADGRFYSHSQGDSSATQPYASASTSKLVTAVVILWVVENSNGALTLDSKAAGILGWDTTQDNPASRITLRHLLSFTSGFHEKPPAELVGIGSLELSCLDNPYAVFDACVDAVYDANIGNNIEPGSQFFYSPSHLQIAGQMAIRAGGYTGWSDLFADFQTKTGLLLNSQYNLPSASNPRLAGGMTWTGEDYLGFLHSLYHGKILSDAARAELWTDQRGAALVVYSPVRTELKEDWGYGLGNWVECASPAFDCAASPERNSSPGAYGAYPFIDFRDQYFGILAREGPLGTFPEGVALFRAERDLAGQWATRTCGG